MHFQSEIGKNRWRGRGGLQFREKESEGYERMHRAWLWEITDKWQSKDPQRQGQNVDEGNLFTDFAVSCFSVTPSLPLCHLFLFITVFCISLLSPMLSTHYFIVSCSILLFHWFFLCRNHQHVCAGLFPSLSMRVDGVFMVASLCCGSFDCMLCNIYGPLLEHISFLVMSNQPNDFIGVWDHACDRTCFPFIVFLSGCSFESSPVWW